MKIVTALLAVMLVTAAAFAQAPVVSSPQYSVNLSFLTGGPYNQTSALDVTFGSQFTTNNRIQADFITMPGASYTGYFGGDSYDLCAIPAVANVLASTSLSCGKFSPFVTGQAGLGRLQYGSNPSSQSFAALGGFGIGYDPTGKGNYTLLFKGGWGHFGPSLPGASSNGFYFYSGISFGTGTSASATQAKIARIRQAEAKKLKKLQAAAAKASKT